MVIEEVITVIFCSIFAAVGLLLVLLEKKGVVKPVFRQTSMGFQFISGEAITLFAVLFGAVIIYSYSLIFAILYVLLFIGLYIMVIKFAK